MMMMWWQHTDPPATYSIQGARSDHLRIRRSSRRK